MIIFRLASLCLLLLISPLSLAEIYKWVDDQGKVHFSETAPDNTPAEKLDDKLQETGNFIDYPELPELQKALTDNTVKDSIQPAAPLTINIELIEYELSADTLQTIREHVQAIYYAYQLWFGWPAQAQYPINIKLFGRVKPFDDYQRLKNYKLKGRSFYSGSPNREIVMKGQLKSTALKTLYHEASHAILHMQQNDSSKWINEGLAQVLANNDGIQNQLPVLIPDEKWTYIIKQMLAKDSLKPVSVYLAIPNHEWENTSKFEEKNHYMVAWSIMYFLSSHQQGRDTLKALFTLNQKQPLYGQSLIMALDRFYPGGINKLDADWRDSMKNLN